MSVLAALVLPTASATADDFVSASGSSDEGAPSVWTTTHHREVFFDSRDEAKFSYRVRDTEPVEVVIRLVRTSTGRTVDRWSDVVRDDNVYTVGSRGLVAGDLLGESRYGFRLRATDSAGATTESAATEDTNRDSFQLRHHRFPVRGKHQYGDGFGAGRGHQGQDVFAACGTELEAARGGRVQFGGYHTSAGNYVVIDGKNTDRDYAYMHLKRRSVGTGDRVRTGQRIGTVGETGNAVGCHLHFELWSGPGWYEGGRALDATPHLKHWDRYS